jgi:hypothetical protein
MPDPGSRDAVRPSRDTRRSPRRRRGNLFPIEGWVDAPRCPQCGGRRISQVDLIECLYPVRGVRKPWGIVVIDPAESTLDATAVGGQFFRCRDCETEWPVEPGTRFMEPDEAE